MSVVGVPGVVGLTGGIGSGKSYVRGLFLALGVPGVDADLLARDIHQDPSHPAVAAIKDAFGAVLTPDGRMDRAKVRALITADETANGRLKQILKPFIMEHLYVWTVDQLSPYVLWESVLIIEEKVPVDTILTVHADLQLRKQRVRDRNPGWPESDIDAMFAMQSTDGFRCRHSDGVLENYQDAAALRAEVMQWHKTYSTRWSIANG